MSRHLMPMRPLQKQQSCTQNGSGHEWPFSLKDHNFPPTRSWNESLVLGDFWLVEDFTQQIEQPLSNLQSGPIVRVESIEVFNNGHVQ